MFSFLNATNLLQASCILTLVFLGACEKRDSTAESPDSSPPGVSADSSDVTDEEIAKVIPSPMPNPPKIAEEDRGSPSDQSLARTQSALSKRQFFSPSHLATELALHLTEGKTNDVLEFLGENKLAAPSAFGVKWALTKGNFEIDLAHPVQDIGEIGPVHRQAINLRKSSPHNQTAPTEQTSTDIAKFFLDMKKQGPQNWAVESVSSSPDLRRMAAEAGEMPAGPEFSSVPNTRDATTAADEFLTAVLRQDYGSAVRWCDPDHVPEEKIAALCIVFEEGEYRMKEERPILTTAATESAAWIIAQVHSEKLGSDAEFGVELAHFENRGWQITALNFSEMLTKFAEASEAGKVPFTPMVKNPAGGDSLVLYFEYDESGITSRAQRQIEIVSSILRADPDKRLRVIGHTDAKGDAEYNRQLSAERATKVKTLLADLGVPAGQIVTEAFGKSAPLRPNTLADGSDNPIGRSHNRRAELLLDF